MVGRPGDTVLIRNGQVFIDSQPLDEPYVHGSATYDFPPDGRPLVVPDRSYFVLGDNRAHSLDSHLGWFVPAENLVGRVLIRYWPPTDIGLLARA